MKICTVGFVCAVSVLTIRGSVFAIDKEENLAWLRPWPKVSWANHLHDYELTKDGFSLTKTNETPVIVNFGGRFFPAYTASDKVRVSFRCRGTVKKTSFIGSWVPMEKLPEGKLPNATFPVKVSEDWKDLAYEIEVPAVDLSRVQVGLRVASPDGWLEVRDVRIEEVPPQRLEGKALLVNGIPIREIAILASDDELTHCEELRAARMLRSALYRNGGDYLPVRTVADVRDIGENAILIGTAAVSAGLVSDVEMGRHVGLDGGFVAHAREKRLGIAGCIPCGVALGVQRFLAAIGIEYLGSGVWRSPKDDAFRIEDYDVDFTPAIAFRPVTFRMGLMPELRGCTSQDSLRGDFSVGIEGYGRAGYGHYMPLALVSMHEFVENHPEFFAVDEKGRRQPLTTNPMFVQYCFSNAELISLIGERMIEIMRANPLSRIFYLSPNLRFGIAFK